MLFTTRSPTRVKLPPAMMSAELSKTIQAGRVIRTAWTEAAAMNRLSLRDYGVSPAHSA
jgi:hypothetical protein